MKRGHVAILAALLAASFTGLSHANLLSDPGFESITGSEPDLGSSPWFSVNEGWPQVIVPSTVYTRSGLRSVLLDNRWGGAEADFVQNLNYQLDATQVYQLSLWMQTTDKLLPGTTWPTVNVELWTSPATNGTYTSRAVLFSGIGTSTSNVWENFNLNLDASTLAAFDGEYMRLRIRKINGPGGYSHSLAIDDMSFTLQSTASQTYYVDPVGGNDANSGTATNAAWQTLARASSTYPQIYVPGDRILLKRDETHLGKLYLGSQAGTSNAPVEIGTYAAGQRPLIDAAGYFSGIHLEDCKHVIVRDLEITGDSTNTVDGLATEQYGVYANASWGNSSDFITLTNLHIYDIYPAMAMDHEGANPTTYVGTAISFQGSGNNSIDYPVSDIHVIDCSISNVGFKAVSMNRSHRILVENNSMWDIGGPALQPGRCTNVIVRGNFVDKSGSFSDPRMHGRGSGIWPWTCKDVLIEGNTFMHARGRADSCGVHIDFGNENIIVQRNLSIDNAGGFLEILGNNSNCTYRYNISINDGTRVKGVVDQGSIPNNQDGHIFWLSGFVGSGNPQHGPYNSYIYNNTVYVDPSIKSTFSIQHFFDGLLIANNIFHVEGATTNISWGTNYTPEMIDSVVWTNNLYSRAGIIPPGFPFEEVDQTVGDPQFSNTGGSNDVDYIPDSGTYVMDQGVIITNLPGDPIGIIGGLTMTADYFGNPITGLPDMGAVEMSLPLIQDGILAGWNFFAPNDDVVNSYADDSSPDVLQPGITALIGGEVNPAYSSTGGGSRSGKDYDQLGITFGGLVGTGSPDQDDSGVLLLRDYNGTTHRNRLDFKVTNHTGEEVNVAGIHFDVKTAFKGGASVTNFGTVKVLHFTPVSDLDDGFSWRELSSSNLYNFAWQQIDVSTETMDDVVLADGETAAFRIEIDWADPAAGGDPTWYVDNVGISGGVVVPVASGYAAWSNTYALVEGPDGDDDEDGLTNLKEYGLGGNPTNGFVDGHLPTFGKSGAGFEYIHVQRNDDTNLIYYLELTDDLVSGVWSNMGYFVDGTNTAMGGDFDEVTNSISATSSNTFIRLIIK